MLPTQPLSDGLFNEFWRNGRCLRASFVGLNPSSAPEPHWAKDNVAELSHCHLPHPLGFGLPHRPLRARD